MNFIGVISDKGDSIRRNGLLKFETINEIGNPQGDEDHSQRGFNFHPVFIPLIQLLGAILDLVTVVDWRFLWSREKFRRTLIVKI